MILKSSGAIIENTDACSYPPKINVLLGDMMKEPSGTQPCWESHTCTHIQLADFKEIWNFMDATKSPSCNNITHVNWTLFHISDQEVYPLFSNWPLPQEVRSLFRPTGTWVALCSGLQVPPVPWTAEKESGPGLFSLPPRHLVSPLLASQTGVLAHMGPQRASFWVPSLPEEGVGSLWIFREALCQGWNLRPYGQSAFAFILIPPLLAL